MPAAATQLVFTSAVQSITANDDFVTTWTIQRQDSVGNPNTTDANLTVHLSSSSVGTGYWGNWPYSYSFAPANDSPGSPNIVAGAPYWPNSGGPTTMIIPRGQSDLIFSYCDQRAGLPTLTVSATGKTSATQGVAVNTSPADHLAVTSPPVVSGGLSYAAVVAVGATSTLITITRQDSEFNPIAVEAPRTITLSCDSGTATFVPASLTITPPATSASFTYSDTTPGAHIITASSTSPFPITSA